MSASHFLDGSIARKHLADSVSMDLATKKKKREEDPCPRCDTAATQIMNTKVGKCPGKRPKRPGRPKK